jgi:hypothetical protein
MKKLIVISDAALDHLYRQELRSTVEGFLKDQEYPTISFVPSDVLTLQSGFFLSQIVNTEEYYGRALNTVIFINNGIHDASQTIQSPQDIFVIRLKSGMYVCGFNIGYNFSFIKHDIEELFYYQPLKEDENPLRSDSCLRLCAHLMNNMQDDLELDERSTNTILETSKHFVTYINTFGEVSTTLKRHSLDGKYNKGDMVSLTIHGEQKRVLYTDKRKSADEPLLYPYSTNVKYDPYLVISGLETNLTIGTEIILS